MSTDVISTTGPPVTNQSCIGLVSSTKTTQEIQQQAEEAAAAEAAARHRHKMKVIAIVLGVLLPLLLISGCVAFWLYRRRKLAMDRDRGVWDGQDVTARVWGLPSGGAEMAQVSGSPQPHHSLLDHKRSSSGPDSNPFESPTGVIHLQNLASPPYGDHSSGVGSTTGASGPSSSTSQTGNTSPQSSDLTPRQRKALEAKGLSPASSSSHLPPGALPPTSPGGPRPRRILDPADAVNGPDIIIQHRDAGDGPIVQELPPPYVNRAARSSAPPAET